MTLDVRREQLLDAGIALFAERAYEDVSIDEIAEACGVSRGLLYHYFRGKREYYVASIAHAAGHIGDVDPDPSLPPTEQLRVGLDRYFAGVEENRLAHAAVRRAAAADAEIAEIVAAQRRGFAERVLAGLPVDAHADGSSLAALTARAWIGAVETAALAWVDRPEVEREAIVTVLSDALVAAMLAAARLDPTMSLPPEIAAVFGDGVADAVAATGS
jgi:AcrR family transcriptional regulator